MKWLVRGVVVWLLGVAWVTAYYLGYLPTRVDDLAFISIEPFHAQGEKDNLLLKFRSNENLRRLIERSGVYGVSAKISICPYHDNPWVSMGRIRHNGVDLETRPTTTCGWSGGKFDGCQTDNDTPDVLREVASVDNTQGPFTYDVYFTYSTQSLTYGGYLERRIPLPPVAQDLCFRVHEEGGTPGLQSNIVVIPKADLIRALGTAKIPPLGPKAWNSDPSRLECQPRKLATGQSIVLKLGPEHGSELAIHRLPDDAWFVLVNDYPPDDAHPLMTSQEYWRTTQLKLPSDISGYKWWSSDGGQMRIFTLAGDYIVYSSKKLEDDSTGLGCLINFSNRPSQ